jgi:hypothetical protein
MIWHTLGKGVSNLTQTLNKLGVSNLTQTFMKFFKVESQKALGNTNKAVKDLNSTPSFNFVLILWEISKDWGILRT